MSYNADDNTIDKRSKESVHTFVFNGLLKRLEDCGYNAFVSNIHDTDRDYSTLEEL